MKTRIFCLALGFWSFLAVIGVPAESKSLPQRGYATPYLAVEGLLEDIRETCVKCPHIRQLEFGGWNFKTKGSESVTRWLQSQPYGGRQTLVLDWKKIEISAEWKRKLDKSLAEGKAPEAYEALRKEGYPPEELGIILRRTEFGWMALREVDSIPNGISNSEGLYSPKGIPLSELRYLSFTIGELTAKGPGEGGFRPARLGQAFFGETSFQSGAESRFEIAASPCGILRGWGECRFSHEYAKGEKGGKANIVAQSGKYFARCVPVANENISLSAAGHRFEMTSGEAEFDVFGKKIFLIVYRGSVEAHLADGGARRVLGGQTLDLSTGAVGDKIPSDEKPGWTDELFPAQSQPWIHSIRVSAVGLKGNHASNPAIAFDGRQDQALQLDSKNKSNALVLEFTRPTRLEGVTVWAGGASADKMCAVQYEVQVSDSGNWTGEESTIGKGAFNRFGNALEPTHDKGFAFKPLDVRFLRFSLVDSKDDALLFELGLKEAAETRLSSGDILREPWLQTRNLLAQRKPSHTVWFQEKEEKKFTVEDAGRLSDGKCSDKAAVFGTREADFRMDLGNSFVMTGYRFYLSFDAKDEEGGVRMDYAVEISNSGEFAGEEVRLHRDAFVPKKDLQCLVSDFAPEKARYLRLIFLTAVAKTCVLHEIELLTAEYVWTAKGLVSLESGRLDTGWKLAGKGLPFDRVEAQTLADGETLGAINDGDLETFSRFKGETGQVLFSFSGLRDVGEILLYASPGSPRTKTSASIMIESSVSGKFDDAELLATVLLEGYRNEERKYDYFQSWKLPKPVKAQQIRLRISVCSTDGFYITDFQAFGQEAEK